MSFRRPSLLTALFALVAIGIMLGLGIWQLDRREWKADLLATVNERLQRPAEPMPSNPGADWEFRRATVEGEVVGNQWFRFPGHSRDGAVGELLMVLVQREDGSIVAVEHGWMPFGASPPPVPVALATEGILRQAEKPGWFTPSNDPAGNAWYVAAPAAIATAAGLPATNTVPLYLKPQDWQPHLPNNHLEYALTWFALAGIFLVIFILFHRKKPGQS